MKSKKYFPFRKQVLRDKIIRLAGYTEIYVSVLVLIGILMLSSVIVRDLYLIFFDLFNHAVTVSVNLFLSTAFELIIGVEFAKMLANNTPGSAVDVLLFTIARQLISTTEGRMLDALIGVIAIAILFAIRKYLSYSSDQ